MTRYRLPVILGGGEFQAHAEPDASGRVQVYVPNVGFVRLPVGALTEIEPPLPPEPPKGSVVLDGKGVAWQAQGPDFADVPAAWFAAEDAADRAWKELLQERGPLTRLVPDPFAEPVRLPWTGRSEANRLIEIRYEKFPAGVGIRGTVGQPATVDPVQPVWGLSAKTAREMARALWAAADAVEATT